MNTQLNGSLKLKLVNKAVDNQRYIKTAITYVVHSVK